MTSKRDFGPLIGGAGALAVVAAVITGFVVVGGPGDARAKRFDAMTMDRMVVVATAARCAMTFSGSVPSTRDQLISRLRANPAALEMCDYLDPGQIERSDEIDYSIDGADTLRLCGDFRRPYTDTASNTPRSFDFLEFSTSRLAGRHCYDIVIRPIAADTPESARETAEPVPAPPLQ